MENHEEECIPLQSFDVHQGNTKSAITSVMNVGQIDKWTDRQRDR